VVALESKFATVRQRLPTQYKRVIAGAERTLDSPLKQLELDILAKKGKGDCRSADST
jgi:hypothetical protein